LIAVLNPSILSLHFSLSQQYQTVGDITDSSFQRNEVIYGRVEKIVDGDTFRVRHYPLYPLSVGSRYHGKLSENTLSIRIYAVDCPETAKFGNNAMPLADEATLYTSNLVNQRVVRIKLLRRDQYNRAVAKVQVRGFLPFIKKDVSVKLAEKGLCTLYTGGGAEYDVSTERLTV
jgi:endonuclease YncB( thermonuclease family)